MKKHEVLRRDHFETLLELEQVLKYSGLSISNLHLPFNINYITSFNQVFILFLKMKFFIFQND